MAKLKRMKKEENPPNPNAGRKTEIWKSEYFVTEYGLQIRTTGSKDKKNPETMSQNIHFEGEALKQLANALQEIQERKSKK